jgi:hypothetical protein
MASGGWRLDSMKYGYLALTATRARKVSMRPRNNLILIFRGALIRRGAAARGRENPVAAL